MEQVDQSIAGYLKFHLITIGFNNGLFDALQEKLSCSELATATKCDERYLKEWCQGMALGGILTCEAKGENVVFQVKSDAYTTIKQKQNMMKLVMSLGGPFDEVSAGFKTGARVDYNAYKDVASLIEFFMADFYEKQFCDILKTATLLSPIGDILSKDGARIMDFGCGCGRSALAMAKGFPNSTIIGYDIDELSIERANMNKGDIKNAQFVCQDVIEFDTDAIPEDEKFDVVTFLICLHDFTYPSKALTAAYKILKESGSVLVLEMAATDSFCSKATDEFSPVAISVMHCLPCSRPPGDGPPGEDIGNPFRMDQLTQIAKNVGFSEVAKVDDKRLKENGFNIFKISK